MITILEKLFVKKEAAESRQRELYGMLCGAVGILLNIFLFAGKLFAGMISGSIAITADAMNNLSDAASSIVTLVGFKLAGQKPDEEHPYGHGRMEYVAGFIVSALILAMAGTLLKDSVTKIIHPEDTQYSNLIVAILVASILVKCYMAFYNHNIGKKIGSAAILATSMDSLTDCIATATVLASTLVSHFLGWQIDGYCGVIVGLFVGYAGISSARDTLNPLLGQPPERAFVEQIEQIVMSFSKEYIIGMHDLIVHDYGPGRRFVSLHAEVPAECDVLTLHDYIDNLEIHLQQQMGCFCTVHMDPVVTTDEKVAILKKKVDGLIKQMDERFTMHDFRMVPGETHTNLLFDVVVPIRYEMDDQKIKEQICSCVQKDIGNNFYAVIKIDKDMGYTE